MTIFSDQHELADADGDEQALPGPLSSLEVRAPYLAAAASPAGDDEATTTATAFLPGSLRGGCPLVLRGAVAAPARTVPEYVFDPIGQVAVDPAGRPLVPALEKDWTTVEGTHTDGDGGDNELWDWEEIR